MAAAASVAPRQQQPQVRSSHGSSTKQAAHSLPNLQTLRQGATMYDATLPLHMGILLPPQQPHAPLHKYAAAATWRSQT